ncbi:MAG: cellulase family glycosylhydrolase, partial [Chloroflexota bacterium]
MPQYGINIDPNNPANGTPTAGALGNLKADGLHWVRLVFNAEALGGLNLDQVCQRYGQIIDGYHSSNIGVLVVLNNQTVTGIAPWNRPLGPQWQAYIDRFRDVCTTIATAFRAKNNGKNLAYEIWNEQDGGLTFIEPEKFKILLKAAADAIKAADPKAIRVSGGLFGSDPIAYMKICRDANGRLPVDAIGVHPYTRFFINPANMDVDLKKMYNTFFSLPLWITEFNDGGVTPENYQVVSEKMNDYDKLLRNKLKGVVDVAIWYSWSDGMNPGFGMIDSGGNPKGRVFDAFFNAARQGRKTLPQPPPPVIPAGIGNGNHPPANFTNQDVLNAFANVGGANFWALIEQAGLGFLARIKRDERGQLYTGTPIADLPNLTAQQKQQLLAAL